MCVLVRAVRSTESGRVWRVQAMAEFVRKLWVSLLRYLYAALGLHRRFSHTKAADVHRLRSASEVALESSPAIASKGGNQTSSEVIRGHQRLRSSPAIASSTWMLTIGLARMHSPPSSVPTNVWWFSAHSESAHTRGGTGTALVASG